MELPPESHILNLLPSYTEHDYEKSDKQGIFSENSSYLDKYVNYDEIYSNYSLSDLDGPDYNNNSNSYLDQEFLEQNYRNMYSQIYSIEKPVLDLVSTFPDDDIRSSNRKTAFYNKKNTSEQHFMEHFNHEETSDWIIKSLEKIDNIVTENENIFLENEINYEDILPNIKDSSEEEMNNEFKLYDIKKFNFKNNNFNNTSISFTELGYEKINKEDDSKKVEPVEEESKPKKEKRDRKDKRSKKSKKTKKIAKSHSTDRGLFADLLKFPEETVTNPIVIDFNTPWNIVNESDEPQPEEPNVVIDLYSDEKEISKESSLFEINFMKLNDSENKSNGDRDVSEVVEPKIILEDKKELNSIIKKPPLDDKLETNEVDLMDQSTRYVTSDSYESIDKNDKATVTYISDDKMFIITGTKAGYVHIWSFLQPYESNEDDIVFDLHGLEKQSKNGTGNDLGSESVNDDHAQMENNTPLRKLEVLGWSHMVNRPDVSFKAHESTIITLHITPKTFSKGKLDYILVTTSLDKRFKVWKISNINNSNGLGNSLRDVNSRKRKVRVDLLGWSEDLKDIFVDAAFIPNTPDKVIVARHSGTVEKFRIDDWSSKHVNETDQNNMSSIARISNNEKCISASISTSCNYYAVGGSGGQVTVYEVETLNLLSTFDCKNKKGSGRQGKEVTGLQWNKKDDFILVTTLDSRVRLLAFYPDYSFSIDPENGGNSVKNGSDSGMARGKKLLYVEKFKGHKNIINDFKARFFGTSEQMVICPSETGQIYIWRISNPLYYPHLMNGSNKNQKEVFDNLNNGIETKNNNHFTFKIEDSSMLRNLNIYNVYEWNKQFKNILKSSKSEINNPGDVGGCMMCRSGPKNQNPNPNNDLLMISSPNGRDIKYSVLDLRYFQK